MDDNYRNGRIIPSSSVLVTPRLLPIPGVQWDYCEGDPPASDDWALAER